LRCQGLADRTTDRASVLLQSLCYASQRDPFVANQGAKLQEPQRVSFQRGVELPEDRAVLLPERAPQLALDERQGLSWR
jgi:hypothetical protein